VDPVRESELEAAPVARRRASSSGSAARPARFQTGDGVDHVLRSHDSRA